MRVNVFLCFALGMYISNLFICNNFPVHFNSIVLLISLVVATIWDVAGGSKNGKNN